MPKPPPRSSSGSSTPRRVADLRLQREHPPGGHLEAAGVEDLRADVRVQAAQVQHVLVEDLRRPPRTAAPPASEKPNFWSSCAVAMNSWVCASTPTVTRTSTRGRTPRSRASAVSRSISSNESTMIRPTPASSARASSDDRLVVAVEADPLRRHPGGQRDGQLAAGADVEEQALLGDRSGRPPCTGTPCPRSRRRRRRRPPRNVAAAGPQVVLVEHVGRRAVLGGQVGDARRRRRSARRRRRGSTVARPQLRHEGVDVLRGTQPGRPRLPRSPCSAPAS